MFQIIQNPSTLLRLILVGISVLSLVAGSHENLSISEECDVYLDLTAVGLQSLPDGFVKNKYITQLTLDENGISSVSSNAFSSTPRLSYLSLAKNNLTTLDLQPFSKLPNLNTLILNGNCKAERIPQYAPQDLYDEYGYNWNGDYTTTPPYITEYCRLQFDSHLPSLVHLFVEDNAIKTLLFISGSLPALTHLHLSHNPLELDEATMSGLNSFAPALAYLYLQNCEIRKLEAMRLPTVKALYLDHNEIQSICNKYCDQTSALNLFEARKLEILSISNNQISKIDVDSFSYTINLLTLDLSHNQISEIREGTFEKLGNLKSLSLEHNRLVQLSAADTFKDLIKLETLYLGGNNISDISSDLFRNMSTLKHLMLNYTKISSIDSELLSQLTSIEILSLAGNQLSEIRSGSLPASGLLITLDLDDNEFTSTDDISVKNEPHMLSLSLKDNPLKTIRAQWIADIGSENLTIIIGRSS